MPDNPAFVKAYKTAVFKIHNPSRHKIARLRDALKRNHLAYTKALEAMVPRIDEFRGLRRGKQRENAIYKAVNPIIKPLPLSIGAKAGVISDVAGQLSSYIELADEQEAPSTPNSARLNHERADYEGALERLAASVGVEEENLARDELSRQLRAGQYRPILFLKNRIADGFLVLWSPEKRRYYAWLNLHAKAHHNEKGRFAEPVAVRDLMDIRTGEVVSFTSMTGALFPLEFGRDHQLEEFIGKARPQSAKLLERNGRFEVHVTFEYRTAKVEPRCYLGVDRGIYNLASLCAVDAMGNVIERRNIDGMALRHVQRTHERRQREMQQKGRHYSGRSRRAMADEAVHTAANEIVAMALTTKAQVTVESLRQLTHRGRKRGRSNFNRVLNRSQYQKLQKVLDYKLAVAGLPRPKEVSAAYTSQTCPSCGLRDRDNRPKLAEGDGFKMDRFECINCGWTDDADLNAAKLIALKRMWRESLPQAQRTKLMTEVPERYSFAKFIRDRAVMRESGSCDH